MNQDPAAIVAALASWLAERWPRKRSIELVDVRPPRRRQPLLIRFPRH